MVLPTELIALVSCQGIEELRLQFLLNRSIELSNILIMN